MLCHFPSADSFRVWLLEDATFTPKPQMACKFSESLNNNKTPTLETYEI